MSVEIEMGVKVTIPRLQVCSASEIKISCGVMTSLLFYQQSKNNEAKNVGIPECIFHLLKNPTAAHYSEYFYNIQHA